MFNSYELATTCGISAAVSFLISVAVLVSWAARRGLLRTGGTRTADALLRAPLDPAVPPPAHARVDLAPLPHQPADCDALLQ